MKGLPMATGPKESTVRVKTEPVSSPGMASSGVLTKFPPPGMRKELGNRLASFKPPRDLSLSGMSSQMSGILNRRVVIPNLKPGRRKGQTPMQAAETTHVTDSKPIIDKSRRPPPNRSRYIQEVGVFSAGLAPGKLKDNSRGRENRGTDSPSVQLEKPKLNLNKNINKKNEDNKMSNLLKDDFIDDPSVMPDLSDCPKRLPLFINAKSNSCRNLEDTFDHLQVKTEKYMNIKAEALDARTPEFSKLFSEPGSTRLIVMDFPDEIPIIEEKKSSKEVKQEQRDKEDPCESKSSTHRLANLGEGHWGTLRILANGAAYILVGKERIPVMMTRHCPRQRVMSVALDTPNSKGELVDLGQVSATLQCFTDLTPSSMVKHE